MFHDHRLSKALQEQKLHDAQRFQEEDQVPAQAEKPFREQIVARLVTLLHIRVRDAGRATASSELDTGKVA